MTLQKETFSNLGMRLPQCINSNYIWDIVPYTAIQHNLSASIHQGDHTIFIPQSVGQQCVANIMMALLQAFVFKNLIHGQ